MPLLSILSVVIRVFLYGFLGCRSFVIISTWKFYSMFKFIVFFIHFISVLIRIINKNIHEILKNESKLIYRYVSCEYFFQAPSRERYTMKKTSIFFIMLMLVKKIELNWIYIHLSEVLTIRKNIKFISFGEITLRKYF